LLLRNYIELVPDFLLIGASSAQVQGGFQAADSLRYSVQAIIEVSEHHVTNNGYNNEGLKKGYSSVSVAENALLQSVFGYTRLKGLNIEF